MKFSDMYLSSKTIAALDSMNIIQPTEVQEKSIPIILSGEDVMVRSQTGTGKTAAFGIGVIEQIALSKDKKCLVLVPTRELALQITKELRAIAINHRLRVYAIYGGEEIRRQLALLERGFDIIVATPGRLLDHYTRGTIDLSQFNIVILDEADRMFDMGFREDIDNILSKVSEQRQTMLFSATLTSEIKVVSDRYMQDPVLIEMGEVEKPKDIEESVIRIPRREKFGKLMELLRQEPGSRVLIFVATQISAEYIGRKLYAHNISSNYLHGRMQQQKRERIMRDFREGRFRVLVATDVASRGLHIEDIAHVINYDTARDKDTHIHRIGRTGRMYKKGKATTFVETEVYRTPVQRPADRSGFSYTSRGDFVRRRFTRRNEKAF